jgi:glutathione peroxidase-family protein
MTPETIYDIPVEDAAGNPTTLAPYKGNVLVIVNTASY